jgi:hypothetical protein
MSFSAVCNHLGPRRHYGFFNDPVIWTCPPGRFPVMVESLLHAF